MAKIVFLNEAVEVDVAVGTSVDAAAKQAGINLYRGIWPGLNCRGHGLCGRCRSWVFPRSEGAVSAPGFLERIHPKIGGSLRLTCQTRVLGDVEVRSPPGGLHFPPTLEWPPDPRPALWKQRAEKPAEPEAKPAAAAAAAKPAAAKPAAAAATASAKPAAAASKVTAAAAAPAARPEVGAAARAAEPAAVAAAAPATVTPAKPEGEQPAAVACSDAPASTPPDAAARPEDAAAAAAPATAAEPPLSA